MFKKSDPYLLFSESIAEANLSRMLEKINKSGVEFRPHFKTHQSRAIGKLFRDKGINSITVSSMGMAEYFANEWNNITIAFPFNPLWIDRLNKIAENRQIYILIDSLEVLEWVGKNVRKEISIWIEVETGSKRSGVDSENTRLIHQMIEFIQTHNMLSFAGFYSHPGHSYREKGKEAVLGVYTATITIMKKLKSHFLPIAPNLKINVGDTPCCSAVNDFSEVDSISCGNFIFYDMTQVYIGSCDAKDVAICLSAPIVSVHKERGEVVVEAGGIHLSKEMGKENQIVSYGNIVYLDKQGWSQPLKDCYVKSISQEHGVVSLTEEVIKTLQPGDFIGILPVHSCMTADCMGEYFTVSGQNLDHFSKKYRDSNI